MAADKKILPCVIVKKQSHFDDLEKMWYVHWRQDGRTLKKYGKVNTFTTVEKRHKALNDLQKEWQKVLNDMTLQPVIRKLKKHLLFLKEEKKWRWKTFQTNMSKIKVLEDFAGKRNLNQDVLIEFFAKLKKDKHPRTYNRYLAEFRSYFKAIEMPHFLPDLKIIMHAKRKSKPARFLKKHELMLLHREIERRDPELWLAVRFMFNLALRPGELRMLQAKHVFLDQEIVQVPAEISKVGIQRFPRIPKSFLPDLQFITNMKPDAYLFQSKAKPGRPVGKNHFARHIRAIMNELGFDDAYKPCYSFRHTAAMKGISDGVPVDQMRRQFGHHSLDQFIQYIRQFGFEDLQEFSEKFEGL